MSLHPQVEENNNQIIQSGIITRCILPKLFAVWEISHSNHQCDSLCNYKAVIILATPVLHDPLVYKFTMLHTMYPVLKTARCVKVHRDTWLQDQSHPILVQRPSTIPEEHNKIYETRIQFDGYAIQLSPSFSIPVCNIVNKNIVLEARFIKIDNKYNKPFQLIMEPNRTITFPSIPEEVLSYYNSELEFCLASHITQCTLPVNPTIPKHILEVYITSLTSKQEICPITFEPLIRETTCITPCGHAMNIDAANHWLSTKPICPVCRESCTKEQIQLLGPSC
jgi:hypothetical protein